MTDDVKKVVAWLRRTAGGVPHLETLLAHIDGEPARLAAACTEGAEQAWDEAVKATELEQAHVRLREVASAREEQREACAEYATERHAAYGWEDREVRSIGIAVRATPLTATPLADEIAALRARVAELERTLRINSLAHTETGKLREKAEAERDELLERHAEFERRLSELDSAKRALKHMTEDRDRLRGLLKGWSPV